MLNNVLEWANPRSGQVIVDATLGGGGYTMALAEAVGEEGLVISLEADKQAINRIKNEIIKRKNLYIK